MLLSTPWYKYIKKVQLNLLIIVGSLPTSDVILCAVCMLLCAVPSFAVLPGVLIYSYGGINCLNSVPNRCYTYV